MLSGSLKSFLLGNHFNLLSTEQHRGGMLWNVELKRSEIVCHHCGSSRTVRAGRCTSLVREESIREAAFWLKIHKHKIYCKSCKKTFTERAPGVLPRRRSTQRFRKSVAQACGKMSDLSTVSRFYFVSHGFAYQVYYEQVERKLKEHIQRKKWPEVVGLDEHFFRRKNGFTEFATMVTDLKGKKVLEVVHGKDHVSLWRGLLDIPGREDVKTVVIDMSSSYRSFAKSFFPNAKLVADKFHVMRLFTPHLMRRGKEIHGHRGELKTRRKLLWSRKELDYFLKVEIDQYLKNHFELNCVYQFKERLYEIYRTKGYARAREGLERMILQMKESSLLELKKLSETFKRWKEEILNYFVYKYTNGFTERMNGTGKLVQRRAFGYKSFRNYRLRVLSACLFKNF